MLTTDTNAAYKVASSFFSMHAPSLSTLFSPQGGLVLVGQMASASRLERETYALWYSVVDLNPYLFGSYPKMPFVRQTE